jgi:putative Mn2+ efflux pump MntP
MNDIILDSIAKIIIGCFTIIGAIWTGSWLGDKVNEWRAKKREQVKK